MGTGLTERGLYENRMGWNDTCIGTGIVGVRQQGWLADCGTSNFRSEGSLFEAVSGKKITAFQIGDYFSSGGIRLVSAGLVSSGDTKATLLELENTGAMKYGISKSSLEDNKIGTDDITTVSFQLNIGSGSFYSYIDQRKLTISYN